MRVLISKIREADRTGAVLHALELATALSQRGHTPIAYSPVLGEVARELRAATIPVVDNLATLSVRPDVIHGHHSIETMAALLAFPGVPAVCFGHSWQFWWETPARFPRMLRYVAVDRTSGDRLLVEQGICNFVDRARFRGRTPLPRRPQRALVFSNHATQHTSVAAVRHACQQARIALDVVGSRWGSSAGRPEELLGRYDLIFAKGRAALEALAVGAAVIVCDAAGLGPMVTTENLERLRGLNFGARALIEPLTSAALAREIARYDVVDAVEVSRRIQARAARDAALDEVVALYEEVVAERLPSPGRS